MIAKEHFKCPKILLETTFFKNQNKISLKIYSFFIIKILNHIDMDL